MAHWVIGMFLLALSLGNVIEWDAKCSKCGKPKVNSELTI